MTLHEHNDNVVKDDGLGNVKAFQDEDLSDGVTAKNDGLVEGKDAKGESLGKAKSSRIRMTSAMTKRTMMIT